MEIWVKKTFFCAGNAWFNYSAVTTGVMAYFEAEEADDDDDDVPFEDRVLPESH